MNHLENQGGEFQETYRKAQEEIKFPLFTQFGTIFPDIRQAVDLIISAKTQEEKALAWEIYNQINNHIVESATKAIQRKVKREVEQSLSK